jgi:hypothetical protein
VSLLEWWICGMSVALVAVGAIALIGPSSGNSGGGVALAWVAYAALMAMAMCSTS